MNKFQQSLDYIESILLDEDVLKIFDSPNYPPLIKHHIKKIQELVDKATPKKLKSKTDKDGRLLWVCPNCGDVYMKFWSDVETISCRKHCDECGQAIKWGDEDDK